MSADDFWHQRFSTSIPDDFDPDQADRANLPISQLHINAPTRAWNATMDITEMRSIRFLSKVFKCLQNRTELLVTKHKAALDPAELCGSFISMEVLTYSNINVVHIMGPIQ